MDNEHVKNTEVKLDIIALILGIISILSVGKLILVSCVGIILSIIVLKDKSGKYMSNTKAIIGLVLSILGVVLALGASVPNTTLPQDVVGQEPYSIEEKIKNMDNDYLIVEKYEFSDTIDKGLVTRITPKAGSDAESGSTVTIYISNGKKQVLPDITGMDIKEGKEEDNADTIGMGIKEAKKQVMPDVIGMDIKKAKKKLKKLGASVEITKKYSKKKKNTVIKADWKKGTELLDNAEVKLIVSKGTKKQAIQNFKKKCKSVSYNKLIRYPVKYEKTPIKVTVTVTKLEAEKFLGVKYDTTIWAKLGGHTVLLSDDREKQEPTIQEGDTITVYGYGDGNSTIDTKEKAYQGSLLFGYSYDKTVDSYDVPSIKIKYVKFE